MNFSSNCASEGRARSHVIYVAIGTERFCISNRDGNASENSTPRQWCVWRDLKIRTAYRAVPPSDNEFYCPTMTRERSSPLIYRSRNATLAFRSR